MKKIHRVILIITLVCFLFVSFVVPASAAIAVGVISPLDTTELSIYTPLIMHLDWIQHDSPALGALWTERGTYYDCLGFEVAADYTGLKVGSTETNSTLYPSGDGNVIKHLRVDDFDGSLARNAYTLTHYAYLLKNKTRFCSFARGIVFELNDFYWMPERYIYEGATYAFGNGFGFQFDEGSNIINMNIEFVIRPIGGDASTYQTISTGIIGQNYLEFDSEFLQSLVGPDYYDHNYNFLGCYFESIRIEVFGDPFSWNPSSYSGNSNYPSTGYDPSDPTLDPTFFDVQLEFDYFSWNYEADIYNQVVADDHPQIPIDTTEYYRDYTTWIGTAVGGFFNFQIFPGFTLGGVVITCIAFAVAIWLLKIFAGG